jgi:hypothetical protein
MPPLPHAAPDVFYFAKSNFSTDTYILNTNYMTYQEARAFCGRNAANPVSYGSAAEQKEVEMAFINNGTLLPFFHRSYWMGLFTTADDYPAFRWLDKRFKGPSAGGYGSWGPSQPDARQTCAVANFTQSNRAQGTWGWNDQNCRNTFPVICRARGGWLLGLT